HSIIQRLIFILLFYTPFLFTKEYKNNLE
ncbi:CPBP family intramembrane metalloprotease, partial [Clostridioides difficile]